MGAPTPPDVGTLPAFTQVPIQRAGENLWEQASLTTCQNTITKLGAEAGDLTTWIEDLAQIRAGSH